MTEFYIGIINRIVGDDRTSFSEIIGNVKDDHKEKIKDSLTVTEKDPIFEDWFSQLKEKGYWSPWMEEWTSATIYRLYRGEEQINV